MSAHSTSAVPDQSRPGAAVEAELWVPAHQRNGQEIAAARVLAVEQRAIGRGRLEGHLKLHEGKVLRGGLWPGGTAVRPERLVEARQR